MKNDKDIYKNKNEEDKKVHIKEIMMGTIDIQTLIRSNAY